MQACRGLRFSPTMSPASLLLLPALFFALPAATQITFDHTDLAVPGDVVDRYRDTIPSFGPGGSGPGQLWDFSAALLHETVTTTISAVGATPYAAAFGGSNTALTDNGADFAYFNNTAASSVATGGAGDPLGLGQTIVAPFSDALTVHQFPRTFGSAFTDTYGFEVEMDGSDFGVNRVRLRHRGLVRDTTDGHGQLVTPTGTYDALRVMSTDQTTDSIWIRLFAFAPWTFFQARTGTAVTYTWLAKEGKLPVGEMAMDSLGAPARFTYSSVAPITTQVDGPRSAAALQVYPVPATDGFTLQLPPNVGYGHAEVLAADGRCVARTALGGGDRHVVATQGWPPGMYAIRVWRRDGGGPEVVRISVQ